jgi:ankyrin repeat protein
LTALMSAALLDASYDVLSFLISKGADVNACDDSGETAMSWYLFSHKEYDERVVK